MSRGILTVVVFAGALGLAGGAVADDKPARARKTAKAGKPAHGRELSSEFASVASAVAPSVVTLLVEADAEKAAGFFGRAYGGVVRGGGSGVVFASDGAILTNHHVVQDARHIEVELHDGRRVSARVLGVDPALDLAVVKAEVSGLPVARFADSDRLRAGDWVVAIGAPFGLRHTVTAGVVSAVDRQHIHGGVAAGYIQTDATINPGNSGGPLVDVEGGVVGINTAYIGAAAGIAFSIPSNLALRIGRELHRGGRVQRGSLGLSAQTLDRDLARYFGLKEPRGALLNAVDPEGPARRAGLVPGDIVYGYGGQSVRDAYDLLARAAAEKPGSTVLLDVWRRGKTARFRVQAARAAANTPGSANAAQTAAAPDPMLGLKARTLTPVLREELGYSGQGRVVISRVDPGSPADRAGLRAGLVVLEADMKTVAQPRDLLGALSDGRMLLRVVDEEGENAFILLQRGR